MKSWIQELSESYVQSRFPVRRDLRENYAHLTEQQKLNLLYENTALYLNSQLENAYDLNLDDLNEEQLAELFGGLKKIAGALVGRAAQVGRNIAADYQEGQAEADDFKAKKLAAKAAQRRNKAADLGGLGQEHEEVPEVGERPAIFAGGRREGMARQAGVRGLGRTQEVVGDNTNPVTRTGGGLGVGGSSRTGGTGKGRRSGGGRGGSCSA